MHLLLSKYDYIPVPSFQQLAKALRTIASAQKIMALDPNHCSSLEILWIDLPIYSLNRKLDIYFNAINCGYVFLKSLQLDLIAITALPLLSNWLSNTERLFPW
ncbi:MAG: hypothetical protein ACR5K4_00365 [Sodalis sp. (in: enterobacteria)]